MRRIEIIGNLGRDGELKQIAGGTSVINFSVAAKGSKRDDESQWHSCALFGKRAETLAEYLKKGQRVFVRGEYKLRHWSKGDKSGVDVDVNVDEVELLGSKDAPKAEDSAPANW
jgi:single-strand DNA-binding protein